MAVYVRFETVLCISVQLILNCYSFRTKNFHVEKNQQILSNHLKTFYGIKSLISCGRKCTENDQCSGASFEKKTLFCTLHFDSDTTPMMTKHSDDISSLIYYTDDITNPKLEERIPVNLKFDVDTLHADRYVSRDRTILSDRLTSDVQAWPPGPTQLNVFRGAVTTYCIEQGQKLQFDVSLKTLDHTVTRASDITTIYVCVADKATIDKNVFCGERDVDGWEFMMFVQQTKIGVRLARKGEVSMLNNADYEDNVVGKNFTVLVDRVNNTISLFQTTSQRLHLSFTDAISNASLCPAFSVKKYGSVKILNSYLIN